MKLHAPLVGLVAILVLLPTVPGKKRVADEGLELGVEGAVVSSTKPLSHTPAEVILEDGTGKTELNDLKGAADVKKIPVRKLRRRKVRKGRIINEPIPQKNGPVKDVLNMGVNKPIEKPEMDSSVKVAEAKSASKLPKGRIINEPIPQKNGPVKDVLNTVEKKPIEKPETDSGAKVAEIKASSPGHGLMPWNQMQNTMYSSFERGYPARWRPDFLPPRGTPEHKYYITQISHILFVCKSDDMCVIEKLSLLQELTPIVNAEGRPMDDETLTILFIALQCHPKSFNGSPKPYCPDPCKSNPCRAKELEKSGICTATGYYTTDFTCNCQKPLSWDESLKQCVKGGEKSNTVTVTIKPMKHQSENLAGESPAVNAIADNKLQKKPEDLKAPKILLKDDVNAPKVKKQGVGMTIINKVESKAVKKLPIKVEKHAAVLQTPSAGKAPEVETFPKKVKTKLSDATINGKADDENKAVDEGENVTGKLTKAKLVKLMKRLRKMKTAKGKEEQANTLKEVADTVQKEPTVELSGKGELPVTVEKQAIILQKPTTKEAPEVEVFPKKLDSDSQPAKLSDATISDKELDEIAAAEKEANVAGKFKKAKLLKLMKNLRKIKIAKEKKEKAKALNDVADTAESKAAADSTGEPESSENVEKNVLQTPETGTGVQKEIYKSSPVAGVTGNSELPFTKEKQDAQMAQAPVVKTPVDRTLDIKANAEDSAERETTSKDPTNLEASKEPAKEVLPKKSADKNDAEEAGITKDKASEKAVKVSTLEPQKSKDIEKQASRAINIVVETDDDDAEDISIEENGVKKPITQEIKEESANISGRKSETAASTVNAEVNKKAVPEKEVVAVDKQSATPEITGQIDEMEADKTPKATTKPKEDQAVQTTSDAEVEKENPNKVKDVDTPTVPDVAAGATEVKVDAKDEAPAGISAQQKDNSQSNYYDVLNGNNYAYYEYYN